MALSDANSSILDTPDKTILSTGNSELDKKIADGLPLGSLNLIEGENDTGKSVLTQQIIWGALKQGFNVDLFSTENTSKSFLSQMESMSLDISDYFAWGYLRVFPMHVVGFEWTKEKMQGTLERMIAYIERARRGDRHRLAHALHQYPTGHGLNVLHELQSLVDHGKTI